MQLKDAFKKSGIGLDIISKIEDEEHKVKLQQLEEEKQRQKQEIEDCKERNRKRKEYDEFVKLVKVKSDNFMFHIICSHIPFAKAEKVFNFSKGKEKHCCFCKTEIMSFEELMNEGPEILMESLPLLDDELKRLNYLKDKLRGRKMGVTSEETKTVICMPCYGHFLDYISNGILNENRIVKSASRKTMGEWRSSR